MACYFIHIPCASSGTKRRAHGTEEPQRKGPTALRRQRYYRIRRPVLPVHAVLPDPATGRSRRNPCTPQTPAVLPELGPVLPVSGTTFPYYRSLLKTPTEAPGLQAVLP